MYFNSKSSFINVEKLKLVFGDKGIEILPTQFLISETLENTGFFDLYFSTLDLCFRAYFAFCLRCTDLAQSSQYLALLDME